MKPSKFWGAVHFGARVFTLPSLGVSTMLSLLLFHVPLSSYLGLVECQLFPSEPKDMVSTSFASMLFRLSHAATE